MNTTTQDAIETYNKAKQLSVHDLNGSYRGRVLSLPGCSHLPDRLYKPILALINSPVINFVWKGKFFNEGQGSNLWFLCKPKFIFAHYDYSNHQDAAHLNYSVARNPKFTHKFSAIIKRSSNNSNLLIGEAFVNGKPTLYFSLEKVLNNGI